ncbi:hypothetical protein QYM36_000594 [Artemia franciscana]|uniref:RRM domain-containing protein n=1 Tax=Artemia franciscana TaxID=6661 RepID=A0AA88LCD3_ARTSF|nr:hypothetical protein QYM36_000594 [Artemia franciscana]
MVKETHVLSLHRWICRMRRNRKTCIKATFPNSIVFYSDEDARQAMALNGERLQDASVRLLLSSRAEMQRVIEQTRSGHPVAPIPPKPTPTQPTPMSSMPIPNMGGMGPLPTMPIANPLLGMPLDPAGLLSALQNPQLAATYAALFQAAAFAQTAALKQEKPTTNAAAMSNESLAAFGFAPTATGAPQQQQQQRISPMTATPNAQPPLPQAPPSRPALTKPEVEIASAPKSSMIRERKAAEEKGKPEEEEERDRYRYGPKSKSSPDRDKKRSRSKERRDRRRWDRSRSRDRRSRSRSRDRRHRRTSPAQRKRDLDEFGRDKRKESFEKDVKYRDGTYRKDTIAAPIPSPAPPKQEDTAPVREQDKAQPLLKQAPKDRAPQRDGPGMPSNEKVSMVREAKSRFSPLESQVPYVDKSTTIRETKTRFSPLEQEVPDVAKIPSPKVPLLQLAPNFGANEFQPFPQNGSDTKKTWAQSERKESEAKPTQASTVIRVFGRFPRLTYKAIRSFFRGIYIKADNIRLISALDGQLASIAYVRFDSVSDKMKALNTSLDDTVILSDASTKEFDQAIDDYQPNKFHREMLYDSCFCVRNLPNDATVESLKVALSGFDILDVSAELVTPNYPNCLIGYVRFSTLQEAEKARELLYSGVLFDDKVVPVALAPVEEYFKSKIRDTAKPTIDETKPKGPASETTFVKGLPPTVTERDILDFFSDAGVFPVRIHFLLDSSNDPSGDAIIEFQNPEDAEKATAKNGSMMGLNTIEVSTISRKKAATYVPQIADSIGDVDMEVEETEPSDENEEIVGATKEEEIEENKPIVEEPKQNVIEPPKQPERSLLGSRGPLHPSLRARPSLLGIYPRQPGPGFPGGLRGQEPRMRPSLLSNSRPFRPMDPRGLEPRPLFPPEQFMDAKPPNFTDPRCVVCLQNIPYKAGIEDILLFFDEFGLRKEQIARKFSDDGFASDEARVCFDSPADVGRALRLNGRKIWNRPIRISPLK